MTAWHPNVHYLNWFGPVDASGFGTHSQLLACAIDAYTSFRVAYIPVQSGGARASSVEPDWPLGGLRLRGCFPSTRHPSVRAVLCTPPASVQLASFHGYRRIAFTVTEVDRVRPQNVRALNECDAVWVPSSWLADVLRGSGVAVPLYIIPGFVDPEIFRPDARPLPALMGTDRFRFLCVGKWEARKGFDVLLRAFAEEFAPTEPVELVVRTGVLFHQPEPRCLLETVGLPDHAPITTYQAPLRSRADMARLYASCSAFVLPSRGEGFGLPVAEAMSCGLPVIATGASGMADLVQEAHAYPLQHEGLVLVTDPVLAGYWPPWESVVRAVGWPPEVPHAIRLRAS